MHHIVLSPHYDDAALSCGGMIAGLAAAGETVIVTTVFGGRPDPAQLSPFAESIHARPDAASDLLAQRLAEEMQALTILGAQPRPGDYLDCIYRRDEQTGHWLYYSEEALFGAVDPADAALVEELAAVFAALAPPAGHCVIYAPLAVGNHVDHQIVLLAARRLQEAGYDVRHYEDYPYVVRDPANLQVALDRFDGGWQQAPVQLSRRDLDRKIAAVNAYGSQVRRLFDAGEDNAATTVAGALDGFARYTARQTQQPRFAERLWLAARTP